SPTPPRKWKWRGQAISLTKSAPSKNRSRTTRERRSSSWASTSWSGRNSQAGNGKPSSISSTPTNNARSRQRHLFLRHDLAQPIRVVGDDAVDSEFAEASHVAALVDRPRQDLEPARIGCHATCGGSGVRAPLVGVLFVSLLNRPGLPLALPRQNSSESLGKRSLSTAFCSGNCRAYWLVGFRRPMS